ncbi:glycoside hydrolase/deacetylase [Acephala macrosclerotiorum]|nr:glycoside hydrolase/deacetylase [Acephala macrosclerotiorum]
MNLKLFVVGALASAALAHSSHEGPSMPKLLGGRKFLSTLKARNALPEVFEVLEERVEERQEPHADVLEARQIGGTDGQCGPGVGTCAAGYCCSPAGWCGVGIDYCAGPDCQLAYGPGCDGNQAPSGTSTASIARPVLGSQPYGGAGIYDCLTAGDIAFTFDDGPYNYTSDLLDKLKVYGAKATFMITGNNLGKGPIDTHWSAVIQRMIAEGHQIASHTWSHQNLSSLDATTFNNQIIYNEMAFRNILGYFPTYMRPPYSECNSVCESRLKTLGYHITYFDLDTEGYLNDSPTLIQNSKNIWDTAIQQISPSTGNYLEIEHDIHYQTVYNLTDYILASMYSNGFQSVTVGDCLGDPSSNWYRSAGGAIPSSSSSSKSSTSTKSSTGTSTAPSSTSSVVQSVSTDGSCSSTITCLGSTFGNCCSQYGYCGSDSTYCGTGCQPGSGTCGVSSSSSSVLSTSGSTSKPSTTSTTSQKTSSTSSAPVSSSSVAQTISVDGTCSATITCLGSTFGNCCSQFGYCGSTSAYCGTGCQPAFGTCGISSSSQTKSSSATKSSSTTSSKSSTASSSLTSSKSSSSSTKTSTSTVKSSSSTKTSSSSTSTATLPVSTDGTCGTKFTCLGSTYGNCCSQYGYCGSTTAYCSTGCNAGAGTCSKVTTTTLQISHSTLTTTSSAAASPTKITVSPDGSCGKSVGHTCVGSRFGLCCSASGKCGNLVLSLQQTYCGVGCQPAYGLCL